MKRTELLKAGSLRTAFRRTVSTSSMSVKAAITASYRNLAPTSFRSPPVTREINELTARGILRRASEGRAETMANLTPPAPPVPATGGQSRSWNSTAVFSQARAGSNRSRAWHATPFAAHPGPGRPLNQLRRQRFVPEVCRPKVQALVGRRAGESGGGRTRLREGGVRRRPGLRARNPARRGDAAGVTYGSGRVLRRLPPAAPINSSRSVEPLGVGDGERHHARNLGSWNAAAANTVLRPSDARGRARSARGGGLGRDLPSANERTWRTNPPCGGGRPPERRPSTRSPVPQGGTQAAIR